MRKSIVRIYLLLFIAGILTWVVTSSAGFYAGTHQDMPNWMANWPPLNRVLFLNALNNIYYLIIALGLFIELLRPVLAGLQALVDAVGDELGVQGAPAPARDEQDPHPEHLEDGRDEHRALRRFFSRRGP